MIWTVCRDPQAMSPLQSASTAWVTRQTIAVEPRVYATSRCDLMNLGQPTSASTSTGVANSIPLPGDSVCPTTPARTGVTGASNGELRLPLFVIPPNRYQLYQALTAGPTRRGSPQHSAVRSPSPVCFRSRHRWTSTRSDMVGTSTTVSERTMIAAASRAGAHHEPASLGGPFVPCEGSS